MSALQTIGAWLCAHKPVAAALVAFVLSIDCHVHLMPQDVRHSFIALALAAGVTLNHIGGNGKDDDKGDGKDKDGDEVEHKKGARDGRSDS